MSILVKNTGTTHGKTLCVVITNGKLAQRGLINLSKLYQSIQLKA